MKRWSAVPRAVAVWAGIVVAVVAYACASQTFSESQFVYPSGDWDTPLPPGVDSNPGEFVSALPLSQPGDSVHTRARPGRCGAPCVVFVRIQTLGNTQEIYPEKGPATGRAIARIQNLDSVDTEGVFGFLPFAQAEYFFWVDRDPRSDSSRFTVLWVPRTGGRVKAGFQKTLVLCHRRPTGYPRASHVDFYEYKHGISECTVAGASIRRSVKEASLISLRPFFALSALVKGLLHGETISDGAWIDCNSGCCT
jgi:hypothetical protein